MVVEASKAVAAATASGDAQQIHAAAKALEAIVRGQVPVPSAATAPAESPAKADGSASNQAADQSERAQAAPESIATATADAPNTSAETGAETPAETPAPSADAEAAEGAEGAETEAATPAEPAAPPKPAAKPVIARRGDDRPGAKRLDAAPAARGGKFGDRKDGKPGGKPGSKPGGPRQSTDNKFEPYRPEREDRAPRGDRPERGADRPAFEDRGPRLGDAAFRAQREAFEAANMALKKLQMQAHGEVLTHVLTAWEKRDPEQVPSVQDFDKQLPAAVRSSWVEAVAKPSGKDASEALLRLEIAADVPTPAEHISARRMLQLQLLTQRMAAPPAETWGEDTAKVLASDFDAGNARRVQNVLKALLKR
jgi:ATP-dependent RNA helicase SUPV3L1/SUV3